MDAASEGTATGDPVTDDRAAERRIEALESEVAAVRRDLWSVRDALIGAQAESATLKVRNRELEVRLAQVTQVLHDQGSLDRLVGRIRSNAALRAAARRVRSLTRGGPGPAA